MAANSVSAWYAAAGDCQRVRSGLIGQPANTVSAAAYLLVGGWLRIARVFGVPLEDVFQYPDSPEETT